MSARSSDPALPPPGCGSDARGKGIIGGGDRAKATRDRILDTAERLFAERGLFAVSNRQIAEAAGQGNTAVVGYHFGTKADLVRALVRRFTVQVEQDRARMLAGTGDSGEIRDWLGCQVSPITGQFAALGSPTWYARFGAQLLIDPALRHVMIVEAGRISPSARRVSEGLSRCLPGLPPEVRQERSGFALSMVAHACAEQERALSDGLPAPRASWEDVTQGLIDALAGMWLAPVTPVQGTGSP
jgi:AcrR family transcriptional regulator